MTSKIRVDIDKQTAHTRNEVYKKTGIIKSAIDAMTYREGMKVIAAKYEVKK